MTEPWGGELLREALMSFVLAAGKNPLFATDATSVHATNIKYDAPQPIFLWRRINGATWTKENLIEGATSATQAAELEKRGKRTTPDLKAGEFVEYGIVAEPSLDPNAAGFRLARFLAYVLIDVLLTPTTLVAAGPDTGLFPGGTFVRKRVATASRTRLRMEVGREPPLVAGPNGFLRLPNPIAERTSGFATLHDVEADPLVPGTSHIALTLLISETGAWQVVSEDFKTKRRKVTVQFKKFKVLNDGDEDPWGQGDEAEIWFRAYKGSERVKEFKWGPGQISDVGAASEVFVDFSDVIIGPDELNGVDPGVGLGLYALEKDYFFWIPSTDEAQFERPFRGATGLRDASDPLGVSTVKPFVFPTGRGRENVSPAPTDINFEITATRIDGDGNLRLSAKVRHVVEYE